MGSGLAVKVRRGMVRQGGFWYGKVRRGMARSGMAVEDWHGEMRLGAGGYRDHCGASAVGSADRERIL